VLTPWSRVHLTKPVVAQLVSKFLVRYETQNVFITPTQCTVTNTYK